MSRWSDRSAQAETLSRAVWDVLATQGLERLTVRSVAAAAGCTTGLVMHRFPNRRALLLHARQLLHETTRARVEALEAAAANPRAALRAVLLQGMATDERTRQESIVWMGFLAAAFSDGELIAEHRRNNHAWRTRVERLTAAAAPDWPAARVASAALALIAMAEGAAAFAAADPAAFPAARQAEMLDAALTAFGLLDRTT
ncbi:TetR family transcriptional regulator C-terminal domain-containing protein [Actinoplanes teichomyceticus]|uniref:TetR family transcriptional regulator n=1 Tax=Actinoplanes teichomyceticus TaxID=1867 RepID=A0A561WPH1_ACTTI|nr:TetR family transcriptional regulator C-terminal domain-containing protein [Actinoplanes teichomyceticus]TWG25760.1 TetR family transcriptional regulator [Actinoplanes teichomyceticus]GIF10836.1 TetR family transcriptional regulator [Actinoplanes teichomyceticus]